MSLDLHLRILNHSQLVVVHVRSVPEQPPSNALKGVFVFTLMPLYVVSPA